MRTTLVLAAGGLALAVTSAASRAFTSAGAPAPQIFVQLLDTDANPSFPNPFTRGVREGRVDSWVLQLRNSPAIVDGRLAGKAVTNSTGSDITVHLAISGTAVEGSDYDLTSDGAPLVVNHDVNIEPGESQVDLTGSFILDSDLSEPEWETVEIAITGLTTTGNNIFVGASDQATWLLQAPPHVIMFSHFTDETDPGPVTKVVTREDRVGYIGIRVYDANERENLSPHQSSHPERLRITFAVHGSGQLGNNEGDATTPHPWSPCDGTVIDFVMHNYDSAVGGPATSNLAAGPLVQLTTDAGQVSGAWAVYVEPFDDLGSCTYETVELTLVEAVPVDMAGAVIGPELEIGWNGTVRFVLLR